MNAIYLTLFVSLILVGGAVLLFAFSFAHRDHDHSARLSLLPLFDNEGDAPRAAQGQGAGSEPSASAQAAPRLHTASAQAAPRSRS